MQILTFRHLKTQGTRYLEYRWRKPKTGKKEAHAQQQMCSENAGPHPCGSLSLLTGPGLIPACARSRPSASAFGQCHMMADCAFVSSWAPLISRCSISNTVAVMASTTKTRKFQTTFFEEQNNTAALFKNIYLVEDLMGFIIFTGKHSKRTNACHVKLGRPVLSLCILAQVRTWTQVSLGSDVAQKP